MKNLLKKIGKFCGITFVEFALIYLIYIFSIVVYHFGSREHYDSGLLAASMVCPAALSLGLRGLLQIKETESFTVCCNIIFTLWGFLLLFSWIQNNTTIISMISSTVKYIFEKLNIDIRNYKDVWYIILADFLLHSASCAKERWAKASNIIDRKIIENAEQKSLTTYNQSMREN